MLLKKRNPYWAGYALPKNVLDEGRFALVTRDAPRGSIDVMKGSPPWRSGYVLPANVRAEVPGRGVAVTYQMPRGWIGFQAPYPFRKPKKVVVKGTLQNSGLGSLGSVDDDTLGAKDNALIPGRFTIGSSNDPIAKFGKDGARVVMAEVMAVPASDRKEAMRSILSAVDPQMWSEVSVKAEKLKTKYSASVALEKAIAAALANHFAEKLVVLGKTGQRSGVLGACCDDCAAQSLDGWLTDFRKALGSATTKVGKATKNALGKLGGLACKATNSGITGVAAAAAGGAAGGPGGAMAGQAGANIAANLCSKDEGAAIAPPPPPAIPWTTIALIGGGALVAVALITRK